MRPALIVFLLSFTSLAQVPAPHTPQKPAEHKITAEEAETLFKDVDELIAFASKDSGMPVRRAVKRKLVSRDEVEKFIVKKLDEDEDTRRIERSELVLKKFGLLPRDFHLRELAVRLLREQIAGFYDPKEKTINLLDWLDPEAQRPVLVHELTHALQDQQIDLQEWLKEADALDQRDPFNKGVRSDEASIARSAVAEGQAMIVLFDYLLAPTARKVADSPGFVPMMREQIASQQEIGAMKDAPLILRESLIFPYLEGTAFEYALLKSGGKEKAFVEALKRPPMNSRQIISPAAYLAAEKQPDPTMPDLSQALKGKFPKWDSGAIGQFDTKILLKQFNIPHADEMAAQWRGGMYFAGQKTASDPKSADDIAMFYVSYWHDAAAAKEFEKTYWQLVSKRYPLRRSRANEARNREELIRVTNSGNAVFVSEGFDAATAARLEKSVLNGRPQPQGALDHGEVAASLANWLAALREMF